jgi:hypothetical protein
VIGFYKDFENENVGMLGRAFWLRFPFLALKIIFFKNRVNE